MNRTLFEFMFVTTASSRDLALLSRDSSWRT
jgi:hypothetical protein